MTSNSPTVTSNRRGVHQEGCDSTVNCKGELKSNSKPLGLPPSDQVMAFPT